MISIHLTNCSFHAYHGMYAEEAVAGGTFMVNARIDFNPPDHITKLEETINYVQVYEIIKNHMQQRYSLLETLAMDIANAIYEADKKVEKINITIYKMNPPLTNFIGNLGISFSKEFI